MKLQSFPLTAALDGWDKELVPPAFPGSSGKTEHWGSDGANQNRKPDAVLKNRGAN